MLENLNFVIFKLKRERKGENGPFREHLSILESECVNLDDTKSALHIAVRDRDTLLQAVLFLALSMPLNSCTCTLDFSDHKSFAYILELNGRIS